MYLYVFTGGGGASIVKVTNGLIKGYMVTSVVPLIGHLHH